ncbi:hypothetical protein FZ025_08435 [Xanthomonas hyacinthi]|nr:hypothetical protein FZ025_08435 [Xanthomonas hyacinthi]
MHTNIANRWAVVIEFCSRLSLVVTVLLIVGCARDSREQRESGNQRANGASEMATACGTVGNVVLRLPSRNAFLGMIYEGEDYWTGGRDQSREKNCDDRLLEASIALTWPGMTTEGASPGLPIGKGQEVIVLSIMPENAGESGKYALNEEAARRIDFKQALSAWSDVSRSKQWNQSLGLYCMPGKSAVASREVCWDEDANGNVRTLVICNMRPQVELALCAQSFLSSSGNTKVEIGYQGTVRSQWRAVEKSAIKFIGGNTVSAGGDR